MRAAARASLIFSVATVAGHMSVDDSSERHTARLGWPKLELSSHRPHRQTTPWLHEKADGCRRAMAKMRPIWHGFWLHIALLPGIHPLLHDASFSQSLPLPSSSAPLRRARSPSWVAELVVHSPAGVMPRARKYSRSGCNRVPVEGMSQTADESVACQDMGKNLPYCSKLVMGAR